MRHFVGWDLAQFREELSPFRREKLRCIEGSGTDFEDLSDG